MSDLISRAMAAFAATLLALAYPGVSVEALTASQGASEGEDLPQAFPTFQGASECPSCTTRKRSTRVRGYSRPVRAPYPFGSAEWGEAHNASKHPRAFIINDRPYRQYVE